MYACIKKSLLSLIFFVNILLLSHGAPRGPSDTAGITDDLKPIGKLAYSIENANPQFATDAPRSPILQAGIADKSASEDATQNANKQQKEELYGEKFIKENERIKNDVGKITTINRISAAKTSNSREAIQLDEPVDNFNIDSAPAAVSQPDAKLSPLNSEWKSTLFGPKGMFTEVFRFVNERRKQGFEKATPQSDIPPPPPINENKFDLPKIFDALMKSSDNGFDDPKIPEIPFIGICNRLNCGDIYKAVDQFKKSELFSNFQTAISLIQDPKGWDVIEELLQNPDLIEQYIGKSGNIQGLLGKSTVNVGKKSSSSSLSILPTDGDLGVDFTNEIDGGNSVSSGNPKPINVATSIDSGSDYYTSVDKTPPSIDYDYEGAETVNVEETVVSKTSATNVSTIAKKKEEPPLPELSFSVDETPEISSSIDTDPDYSISVDTVVPSSKNAIGIKKQQLNALERRFVLTTSSTSTSTRNPPSTTTIPIPLKQFTSPKPRKNFRRSDDYYSMYYDNN